MFEAWAKLLGSLPEVGEDESAVDLPDFPY